MPEIDRVAGAGASRRLAGQGSRRGARTWAVMQAIALLLLMAGGAALCAVATRSLTARWRLPWRDALVYFGIAAHPDE